MYLTMHAEFLDSADTAQIAAQALESLIADGIDDPEFSRLEQWDFERLFALLGKYRDHLGAQRVLHIEWQLFPLLGLDADAPTLHAALAEQPIFFAELVSTAFGPDTKALVRIQISSHLAMNRSESGAACWPFAPGRSWTSGDVVPV
jgi:hypothetical protein